MNFPISVISLIHGQDNNNVSTTTVSPSITTSNNIVMTVTGRSKEMTAKQRLRAHLMQNYDKNIHPVEDHNEAVQVRLGMALIHLDIDEKKSLMTADAWMRMAWNDPNLAWQREIFENVSLIHFGSDEIWKPDILLYNSAAEAGINHYGNTNALVEPNGDVLWVRQFSNFPPFCFCFDLPKSPRATADFCQISPLFVNKTRQNFKFSGTSWAFQGLLQNEHASVAF